jgi:hypothetical protein
LTYRGAILGHARRRLGHPCNTYRVEIRIAGGELYSSHRTVRPCRMSPPKRSGESSPCTWPISSRPFGSVTTSGRTTYPERSCIAALWLMSTPVTRPSYWRTLWATHASKRQCDARFSRSARRVTGVRSGMARVSCAFLQGKKKSIERGVKVSP